MGLPDLVDESLLTAVPNLTVPVACGSLPTGSTWLMRP
jgi:hypothetical protein